MQQILGKVPHNQQESVTYSAGEKERSDRSRQSTQALGWGGGNDLLQRIIGKGTLRHHLLPPNTDELYINTALFN